MKLDAWKNLAYKLLGLVSVLFLFGLMGAVVEGSCFWLPALLCGLVCLVVLNGVCGALLPQEEKEVPERDDLSSVSPSLTLAQGGKVA